MANYNVQQTTPVYHRATVVNPNEQVTNGGGVRTTYQVQVNPPPSVGSGDIEVVQAETTPAAVTTTTTTVNNCHCAPPAYTEVRTSSIFDLRAPPRPALSGSYRLRLQLIPPPGVRAILLQ